MAISCRNRYSHRTTTIEQVSMGPVGIITSIQRRRPWTPGDKKAIVEETELADFRDAVLNSIHFIDAETWA